MRISATACLARHGLYSDVKVLCFFISSECKLPFFFLSSFYASATKSPEELCFWVIRPSVIGCRYRNNLRTPEEIQVKLGTSLYNDIKMNC